MKQKRISFGQGKGSITHNNRTFIAKNVDENRIRNNVTFIAQPIDKAYENLFGESLERYNARQKRNDRKIHESYYEHLFHCKPSNSVVTAAGKRKSFYEDIVQIGKMEDSGFGTEDFSLVAECLKEYMNGFQQRNPNFYVFNAVLHLDEATPHLHIDYIPVGHYKHGMDIQNGIAQALKEMGYGIGKDAIARWRASEMEILNAICLEHGIEPLPPEKSRGTLECEEYKEQCRKAEQVERETQQAQSELDEINSELKTVKKKKAKIVEIDSIEIKKTIFGGKVTLSQEDYENLASLAKKEVANEKNTKKLKSENAELSKKLAEKDKKIEELSEELAEYKKPATISIKTIKQQSQRISETERIKSGYNKAMAFIDAYGLKSEYDKFRYTNTRKFEIE